MNDEQRILLESRLKAAAEQQPEVELLRKRLLEIGGVELVPPPTLDPDLPNLIQHGLVMTSPVVHKLMVASACHENVAELWLEKATGISGIGTGYALSEDGLWRRHSWAIRNGDNIETTTERIKYFGIIL